MKRARWWWGLYGACAAAVVLALFGLSSTALDFERRNVVAATHARHQDRLRLALWRMDSLVLPLLSREGARAYFEYLAYYPQDRAYNRFLTELEKGEVLTPSPLLNFAPEFIRLHFQVDHAGTFTSPQVPNGNLRDLAASTCLPPQGIASADACLADVRVRVPLAEVRQRVGEVEKSEAALSGRLLSPHPLPDAEVRSVAPSDPGESQARQKTTYKSKRDAQSAADNSAKNGDAFAPLGVSDRLVHVGTLVPLWLGEGTAELFFFRRVGVGNEELLQGIWLDWPALQRSLLSEVNELLPGARLEPLRSADANWTEREPSSLATIPVRLIADEAAATNRAESGSAWRPVHGTLLLTWGVTAAALVAGGFVLRAILALGERRNRFASAVTHELRTPLTTFRMYSEMLADEMVSEPAQRALYLQTLKEESTRLSTLVENVLAYARLEDGRGAARRESLPLRELVERHQALLERRARDAGLELVLADLPEVRVDTDADAVGQILYNLVDNAAKYARSAQRPRIELGARVEEHRVVLRVRDYGPGIEPATARRIFAPFDRGTRNGDPTPGVGLGLALARGISADLGGSLDLVAVDGPGAAFELTLPRAR